MLTATPDGGLQSTERNGYGKSRWLCVQFVAVVLKECLDIVSDLCVELGGGLDDLCESLWWVGLAKPCWQPAHLPTCEEQGPLRAAHRA